MRCRQSDDGLTQAVLLSNGLLSDQNLPPGRMAPASRDLE
jgi:hypothetical protein